MYIKTGQPPAPMLAHAHANIHIYIYRCSGPRQSGPSAACVQAARACSCVGVHAYHICIYMPSAGRLGSDRHDRGPPFGRTTPRRGCGWESRGQGSSTAYMHVGVCTETAARPEDSAYTCVGGCTEAAARLDNSAYTYGRVHGGRRKAG